MLFSVEEEREIIQEIRAAESLTTGEIRVYVEDYCFRDTPILRAAEVFHLHGMTQTQARNGVLIYISERSRQFAIWGDEGVYPKELESFWMHEKCALKDSFIAGKYAEGVILVIRALGTMLANHFPSDGTHKNELPDEIMYG